MTTELEHGQRNQAGDVDNLESEFEGLPEKFQGKTIRDVATAYAELEREKSRLANELGESRRTISTLIDVQPKVAEVKETRQSISADELLTDPNKTLDQAIESHPAVRQAKETSENLERQLAQKTFESEYPKYKEDLADASFLDWVKKNPVRTTLAAQANNYDLNSARALWDMWGEHKELTGLKADQNTQATKRRTQEREGTLEGSSGAETHSTVVLNRADLRELQRKMLLGDKTATAKWNDPKFRATRLAAYADGRVE